MLAHDTWDAWDNKSWIQDVNFFLYSQSELIDTYPETDKPRIEVNSFPNQEVSW